MGGLKWKGRSKAGGGGGSGGMLGSGHARGRFSLGVEGVYIGVDRCVGGWWGVCGDVGNGCMGGGG